MRLWVLMPRTHQNYRPCARHPSSPLRPHLLDPTLLDRPQFVRLSSRRWKRHRRPNRWHRQKVEERRCSPGGPATPLGPHVIHPPHSIPHHLPILGEDDPLEDARDFE